MKDCALLATLSPLIHSILVRSGLFYHTTHHVWELIFYIRILSIIFFEVFHLLKGPERWENRRKWGTRKERILFSNQSTLEKVARRLLERVLIHGLPLLLFFISMKYI